MKSAPFQPLRKLKLLETDGSHFLNVLRHPRAGTSAHKWLRILHNRAQDLGWLLAPVLARKLWPKLRTKKGKAITAQQQLIATEKDDEFRLYLEMLWKIGYGIPDLVWLSWRHRWRHSSQLRKNPAKLHAKKLTAFEIKLVDWRKGMMQAYR